jgi:quinol monooxygenase YgiN
MIVVVGRIRTDDALQKHFGAAHIADSMRAVPQVLAGPPDVKFHTVESSRDTAAVAG